MRFPHRISALPEHRTKRQCPDSGLQRQRHSLSKTQVQVTRLRPFTKSSGFLVPFPSSRDPTLPSPQPAVSAPRSAPRSEAPTALVSCYFPITSDHMLHLCVIYMLHYFFIFLNTVCTFISMYTFLALIQARGRRVLSLSLFAVFVGFDLVLWVTDYL